MIIGRRNISDFRFKDKRLKGQESRVQEYKSSRVQEYKRSRENILMLFIPPGITHQ
jgi:hypothetical protein